VLVASAYFARSAQIVADAAAVLGRTELAEEYAGLARAVRAAFRAEYVAPSGLISSDSVTAYALAIAFDLYDDPTQRARAATRIAELAEQRAYQISTGFVGTPLVLPALTAAGDTRTAYRLVTETACPSWLYTVTMGATTIWERWDSMLPDGSINPGEMTSFNHYALGSVADWLHRTVGGLAPAAPGYRELRVAPQPGRGVVSASSALRTPYGRASCAWHVDGTDVTLDVTVPANASATVVRPGHDGEPLRVLAGVHHWEYSVPESVVADWADEPRDDVPFGS
jgi:alpha-L-rhamnosidase